MDSPERSQSYGKREAVDSLEGKRDGVVDEEEWEGSGKRKHKLSKSQRSSNEEDIDGWDGSGRRKSSGDRSQSRRQSGGSSRVDIDEGDYDAKKDSSSKLVKKKQGSSSLENLSSWYQEGDVENRHDGGEKFGNRSHPNSDDNERNALRKSTSKFSDNEGSHRRTKSRDERARGGENEKALDRDTYHSDRKEISREKGYGFSEEVKSIRKWDESEVLVKPGDVSFVGKSELKSGLESDLKHESIRERSISSKIDAGDVKDRALESTGDKSRSYSKEERRIDSDRPENRGRSHAVEEDNKAVSHEDTSGRERNDRHREMKLSGSEAVDNRGRSYNPEDDGSPWMRDITAREGPHSQSSRSPDRSGRHRHDLENSEMEYERSSSFKRKDIERDVFRDDRLKGRENNWSDRNREREGSRESWKRRQQAGNDRDADIVHDRDRERDLPRRGRDRMMDNERGLGRGGNRKDGRSEAVKASTNFGISTENYDVIEIQPKPLDYGRDDSSFGRKTEAVPLHDPKLTTHNEWGRLHDDIHRTDGHVPATEGTSVKSVDDFASVPDQNAWKDDVDGRPGKLRGQQSSLSGRPSGGQSSSSGSQPFNTNQDASSFGRVNQQGHRGNRLGRVGRVRPPGRDNQQVNIPVPLMGSPFGHLGMPPPGPMQPMNPGMSPGPGPPVPPGFFVSPFSPPVWPGSRGIDLSMLPLSPGVSSIPPGPPGQRFPHMGTPPHPALHFNQPGLGRGVPPGASGPGFNPMLPIGRGNLNDKTSGDWVSPNSGGPLGKAPFRGEQNDYSQNFVDTGSRPQNFIRELELTNVEDYPKLRELIQKKDEIVDNAATPPMYYKCDLKEFFLSPEFFGTKFDVILVDPPWEEYVHRAPGVTDHMDYWTFEEIKNLKIEAIADTPSFIFLWVGDSVGLEQGRQCLKKWGFRRCEDICWVKTNKTTANPGLRHETNTLFQHTKEHCLMGIKGTVRRSSDGHIIHANIDTDVIIAEEPAYGSTAKPDEMYRIIEHFALGRRRIELFGEDHNIRKGWLTVGKGLSSSNFNAEAYVRSFADKDGKVWQGGGGRNPPPEAPHLVQTTPDIESLRPKSPMKNQQQMQQQQSNSISLTSANSSSRRPVGNSPQNPPGFSMNAEASGSNHPVPWAPTMEGFKGPNENIFDMYGYNMRSMQPGGEFIDFDTQQMMGMM